MRAIDPWQWCSPWEQYKVEWDDGQVNMVNAWEVRCSWAASSAARPLHLLPLAGVLAYFQSVFLGFWGLKWSDLARRVPLESSVHVDHGTAIIFGNHGSELKQIKIPPQNDTEYGRAHACNYVRKEIYLRVGREYSSWPCSSGSAKMFEVPQIKMILLSSDSLVPYLVIWRHTDQLRSPAALVACMDKITHQQHVTPWTACMDPQPAAAQI
eukprot:365800-Chlamydomonas_euryale.AAC.1